MNKPFPKSLLFQESSDGFELKVTEVNLHHGEKISPGQGKTTLLAAGFSSIYPDNSFPLSPTLQLNSDLSRFSSGELQAIAHAELQRHNRVNYRSYTVDVDTSVCVVSADASLLKSFAETYGGVLELEPLLIKGYDPEIPTATELNLDVSSGQGCRIEYQERSPIDLDQCFYCGECGTICPFSCISEELFVNYDVCNFCKECEKGCPAGAIDIHGAVMKTLEVAAVVLLGDVKLDFEHKSSLVFNGDNLKEFFATLFPYQIDEVVACDTSLCQYNGGIDHGCKLCFKHCKFDAVKLGDQVTIDSRKCEECGACVGVCPTGAIQNLRFADADFVEYWQSIPLGKGSTVVVGDEKSLQRIWWRERKNSWDDVFFHQYETVESLSLFHFMFLLNQGARRIVVISDVDEEQVSFATSSMQRQIELASEIVNKLYDIEDSIVCCADWNVGEVLSKAVEGDIGHRDQQFQFVNRRKALADVLEDLVVQSGREVEISVPGYIPFATVSCRSGRCTQCMACLNECRIGAMIADQDQLSLNHIGAMCVGCGLCSRICPEDALVLSPEFTLAESFFAERELAKADPMVCKTCGKVFGTKKSFERVMAILKAKESVDVSHFEHCEDCRVKRLFEANE